MSGRRLWPLLLLALLLAACGGAPSSQDNTGGGVAPDLGAPSLGGKEDLIAPLPYPTAGDGSALIVSASLSLQVDDLETAIEAAKARVRAVDGVLTGFSRGGDGYPIYAPDGSQSVLADGPATLMFRVPAERLEALTEELRALGRVTSERSDASDVSASLRDLAARLKNLRAAETNYVRLLERAENVGDLLAVQAQLDMTRGEIERLAAEEAAMSDAVARSSISLTLYGPTSPVTDAADAFDLRTVIDEALANLLRLGQGLLGLLIYLLVFGLPLGALLGLGLLIGRAIRRPRR